MVVQFVMLLSLIDSVPLLHTVNSLYWGHPGNRELVSRLFSLLRTGTCGPEGVRNKAS